MKREVRVGVLASGRGSNFEALVQASQSRRLQPANADVDVRVVCLATDNPEAPALDIARRHGVPAQVVHETASRGRLQTANEQALCDFLVAQRVDLVCLAGFMRIVRGSLLQRFPDAILNLHPSLLPSFPGLHAAQQALDHGARVTGCTVHFVDAGIDTGPILLQASVPIHENDDLEDLESRIHEQEHRLYPEAVALWASGRVQVRDRRVVFREALSTSATAPPAGKEELS